MEEETGDRPGRGERGRTARGREEGRRAQRGGDESRGSSDERGGGESHVGCFIDSFLIPVRVVRVVTYQMPSSTIRHDSIKSAY